MVSIISLLFLEIILSIDNLIFISSLITGFSGIYKEIIKFFGLGLALCMRLGLLLGLNKFLAMDNAFAVLFGMEITYKELIFILGGVFLIYKGAIEIKHIVFNSQILESDCKTPKFCPKILNNGSFKVKFVTTIISVIFVDLVFSIDSIVVAIALVSEIKLIAFAMIVSMCTLLISVNVLAKVLKTYPSLKLLAISFIVMLGCVFVLDGLEIHVERSYLHFALIFAVIFECCDIMRLRKLGFKENTHSKTNH